MASRLSFVSDQKFHEIAIGIAAGRLESKSADDLGILKGSALREIKAIDKANRILDICISTDSIDRMEDTIALDGWQLENYIENPVVLFGHDQWNPPVAQSIKLWKAPGQPGELWARAQFVERDIYPFAYMMFQLYVGRYMRAASVGFKPTDYEMSSDRKGGIDFKRQELLEWSCVPVPANAEALAQARAAKIDLAPMKSWAERWLDTCGQHDQRDRRERDTVERLRAASDPTGRSLVASMGDLRFPPSTERSAMSKPSTPPFAAAKNAEFPCVCAQGHGHKTEAEAVACAAPAARKETDVDEAGEEAAELVQYEAMLAHLDSHAQMLAAVRAQVAALIAAETESPTETDEAEAAEEAVEMARLSVILGQCTQMHGSLAGLESLATACLMGEDDDDVSIGAGMGGAARGAEGTRGKSGARHSAADLALGKKAAGYIVDGHAKMVDLGFAKPPKAKPGDTPANDDDADKAAKAGARHSAADLATGKAAVKCMRDAHGTLVELGFAEPMPDAEPDEDPDAGSADDKAARAAAAFDAMADDVDLALEDLEAEGDETDEFEEFLGMSREELRASLHDSVKDAIDEARGRIID
jgi:hypothetical protein